MLPKPYEYWTYDDLSRLRCTRVLWKKPEIRAKLIAHWMDARHPYRERFVEKRPLIENILECFEDDMGLDERLKKSNSSLRCVIRDLPPVFGHFWETSSYAGKSDE